MLDLISVLPGLLVNMYNDSLSFQTLEKTLIIILVKVCQAFSSFLKDRIIPRKVKTSDIFEKRLYVCNAKDRGPFVKEYCEKQKAN